MMMMNNNLAMEDNFGCLWNYEENIEELKEKVLVMSYELESTRKQANEEMKKNEDRLLELLNRLQIAYKERDEARHQLHTLLNHYSKTTIPPPKTTTTTNDQHFLNNNNNSSPNPKTTATFTPLSPQSPIPIIMIPTTNNSKTATATAAAAAIGVCNNSSTTASNSPSIDSFFDTPAVSSPDFSTFNAVLDSATDHLNTTKTLNFSQHHQQPLIPDFSSSLPPFSPTPLVSPDAPTTNKPVDQANVIISSLAKGRPLPQKGNLLQAVMEAGPLLQTLMVAGPLPRWRNPPPAQPLHIPPFQAGSTFATSNIDNTTSTTTSSSILLSGRGLDSPRLTTSSAPPAAKRSYDSMITSRNFSSCGGSSTQMYNNSNMLNFGGLNGGGSSMAGRNTGAGVGCAGGRMMMTSMMSGTSRVDNFLINSQYLSSLPKRQRIL